MKYVFGNYVELAGLDHIACQEVSGIFIIISDTSILVYEQILMVCIEWYKYMG